MKMGYRTDDLSPSVPRPKIYVEENIPETWSPEEVRQLLSVIDRSNAIGKRDYAMLLLAIPSWYEGGRHLRIEIQKSGLAPEADHLYTAKNTKG